MTPHSDEEIRAMLEIGMDDDRFNDVAFDLADEVPVLLDRVTAAERRLSELLADCDTCMGCEGGTLSPDGTCARCKLAELTEDLDEAEKERAEAMRIRDAAVAGRDAALAEVARLKTTLDWALDAHRTFERWLTERTAERDSLQARITNAERFAEPRGPAERRDPSTALGRSHTVREFLAALAVPTEPETTEPDRTEEKSDG